MLAVHSKKERKAFKKGIDFDNARRRRSKEGVEVRKHRRMEGLQKRRAIRSTTVSASTANFAADSPAGTGAGIDALTGTSSSSSSSSNVCTSASGGNGAGAMMDQRDETDYGNTNVSGSPGMKLPQFLSHLNLDLGTQTQTDIHTKAGCGADANILDSVIELLTRSTSTSNTVTHVHCTVNTTQHGTANIKHMLEQTNIVPTLIHNLRHPQLHIREQSALCLGNIAGEMPALRDYVIQCGVITPILENITSPPTTDEAFLEKIVWSLSNICRGKQTSEMNNIIPVFPVLIQLLQKNANISSRHDHDHNSTNTEILLNACWALAYLTEDNDSVAKELVEQNLVLPLVSFLTHKSAKIAHVALRILGNFILSGYIHEIVIDAKVMEYTSLLFMRMMGTNRETTSADAFIDANAIANMNGSAGSMIMDTNMKAEHGFGDNSTTTTTTSSYQDDKYLRNEAFYFLSLITDSGTEYIDVLLNTSPTSFSTTTTTETMTATLKSSSTDQIKILCHMMQSSPLSERMEAIWVIFNICKNGTDMQLQALVNFGAIPALCANLTAPDIKFVLLVLDSIENFLLVGERLALDYRVLLQECGGLEKMEKLLDNPNDDVYRKTNAIFEKFFDDDNDYADEWDDEWY